MAEMAVDPIVMTAPRVRRHPARWLLLIPLAFIAVFFVYPVTQLLALGLTGPSGNFSLANFIRLVSTPVYFSVLLTTFKIAGLVTLLSVLIGYPIAYFLAISTPGLRNRLLIWVLIPFWTSTLVRTFSWIVILGRNGPLNQLVLASGLSSEPLSMLNNLFAVVVGMTHALTPLAILTMLPVLQAIPQNLMSAAATMGAPKGQVFWRIYFPLSISGVAAAALLVFVTALGFFITPSLLGGLHETILPQIIIEQLQTTLDWGFAATIALLLLVVSAIVFVLYDRVVGLSTLSGRPTAPQRETAAGDPLFARLGRSLCNRLGDLTSGLAAGVERILLRARGGSTRWPSGLSVVARVLLFLLVAPAFFIGLVSFTEQSFINWPPVGFTLHWYGVVLSDPAWVDAAGRSLVIGVATGLCSTALGTLTAYVLMKADFKGKAAILTLFMLPAILPRMIIALGLFYLFAKLGLLGSMTGLVIGHTVLAQPFVIITVIAMLKGYDTRLDQAAATLGANSFVTFKHVMLPLIRPCLVSAFVFSFVISFDELTIALFTTGGLSATLPKVMWDEALLKVTPALAAVSGIMLLVLTGAILLGEALRRRSLTTLE